MLAAARPVSTPRCPPGALASRTSARCGSSSSTWWKAGGAIPSPSPAIESTGTFTSASAIVRPPSSIRPVREVVVTQHAAIELAERATGVGEHVRP